MKSASDSGQNSLWPYILLIVVAAIIGTTLSIAWNRDETVVTAPAVPPSENTVPTAPATAGTSADESLVKQFREFEEWCASREMNARDQFRGLIKLRLEKGIGEDWERQAAKDLEQAGSSDKYATNPLIAPGLRAFFTDDDTGIFLRASLKSPAGSNDTGKYTKLWKQWFSSLDKSNGCVKARRYLCDRIADLTQIRSAADPLSLLTLNEQEFPLLVWAGKLRHDELREAFESINVSHFPFITPVECDIAELVSESWPADSAEDANPVDRLEPQIVAAWRRQLKAERSRTLEGVSEAQRLAATEVFDGIERLCANEDQRASHVFSNQWKRPTVK